MKEITLKEFLSYPELLRLFAFFYNFYDWRYDLLGVKQDEALVSFELTFTDFGEDETMIYNVWQQSSNWFAIPNHPDMASFIKREGWNWEALDVSMAREIKKDGAR